MFKCKFETLQQRSKNVINIFNKTINDLTQINNEIEVEQGCYEDEIAKLQDKVTTLNTVKEGNSKIIDKLSEFFSF